MWTDFNPLDFLLLGSSLHTGNIKFSAGYGSSTRGSSKRRFVLLDILESIPKLSPSLLNIWLLSFPIVPIQTASALCRTNQTKFQSKSGSDMISACNAKKSLTSMITLLRPAYGTRVRHIQVIQSRSVLLM